MNRIEFLLDQRTKRRMLLRNLYVSESNIEENPVSNTPSKKSHSNRLTQTADAEHSNNVLETVNGLTLRSRNIDYNVEKSKAKGYNMLELDEVAIIADRYNVSNVAAAAISTAALAAAGLINENNTNLVCDRKKIMRSRVKQREKQLNNLSFDGIRGLYFDGRIDETMTYQNGRKQMSKEDHIAFAQQPGSFFIGHKTVQKGSASMILNAIQDLLAEKSIDPNQIDAMGCDGTVTNTGHEGGAIRLFELAYNRPVQWNVCMLHLNELPLRALIEKLDGKFKSKNLLTYWRTSKQL